MDSRPSAFVVALCVCVRERMFPRRSIFRYSVSLSPVSSTRRPRTVGGGPRCPPRLAAQPAPALVTRSLAVLALPPTATAPQSAAPRASVVSVSIVCGFGTDTRQLVGVARSSSSGGRVREGGCHGSTPRWKAVQCGSTAARTRGDIRLVVVTAHAPGRASVERAEMPKCQQSGAPRWGHVKSCHLAVDGTAARTAGSCFLGVPCLHGVCPFPLLCASGAPRRAQVVTSRWPFRRSSFRVPPAAALPRGCLDVRGRAARKMKVAAGFVTSASRFSSFFERKGKLSNPRGSLPPSRQSDRRSLTRSLAEPRGAGGTNKRNLNESETFPLAALPCSRPCPARRLRLRRAFQDS